LSGALQLLRLTARSQVALTAEIVFLFLRKQLAFYQERKIKPRQFNDSARLSLLLLAKLFAWKKALINVKPAAFQDQTNH
jgi:putative transposase